MASQFKYDWTQKDLDDYYNNLVSQVDILRQRGANKELTDVLDDYIQYFLGTLRKVEQYEKLKERVEELLFVEDIELPMKVIFDPMVKSVKEFAAQNPTFPTFYSSFDPEVFSPGFGQGTFIVSFPPRATELTDDEMAVAIKHEFGHIRQDHIFLTGLGPHSNSACDVSINCGMTQEEQQILLSVASKLFRGGGCFIRLDFERNKGGLGLKGAISSPGNYVSPLQILNNIGRFKKDENGGTDGTPPPQQDEIKVGDIIEIRGTKPQKYGRVISVMPNPNNPAEMDYDVEELSQKEFDDLVEQMRTNAGII